MSKIKRIPEKEKETEVVDYEKLRVDVLKSLADGRNIDCKQNKEEIIKDIEENAGTQFDPIFAKEFVKLMK